MSLNEWCDLPIRDREENEVCSANRLRDAWSDLYCEPPLCSERLDLRLVSPCDDEAT